ncbi:MAG: nucleotidyltransferase [Desulfomicrobium sp.]
MITKEAHNYLEALSEELNISETRYKQAHDRYNSLGQWLNRDTSLIKQFKPSMYIQGSFAFGTVIKPLTDAEEYDVDMVCELKNLSKNELSQNKLKKMLGLEIEAYRLANNMQKKLEERRRCWALNYADGAQFHIDIVSALPNGAGVRLMLEQRNLDATWSDTAISITDNEVANYNVITDDWPRSNPKGYREWFKSRMIILLERRKAELAKTAQANVEDIPDYRVRTPLQSAIMILKRHRDIMFADDETNLCPISIIITTLAGHSYQGEEQIAEALFSILSKMDRFVLWDGQKYVVPNPSDPSENFADKWEEFPDRKDAFFQWLAQARRHFQAAAGQYSRKVEVAQFV